MASGLNLRKLAMAPVWFGQIFTQAKDFQKNPLIGSSTLNKWGLHIARVRAAHGIGAFRRALMAPFIPSNIKKQYKENGYIVTENFLSPEIFDGLKKELEEVDGDVWEMTQGDTATLMAPLDKKSRKKLSHCNAFLSDPRLLKTMSYVSSNFGHPISFLHCVKNQVAEKKKQDPQKVLHMDTFQPTAKYWLFLDDVELGAGPFVYVPGSHKVSKERLKWEYETSCQTVDNLKGHSVTGSFRISEEELKKLGLTPKPLTVKANTLVVADTYGFHRRGDVDHACSRLALYGSTRVLPFNPLPGFGSKWLLDLQYYAMGKLWRKTAEKAKAKGGKPIWDLVSPDKIKPSQIDT